MDLSAISNVAISAFVAISCFIVALLMTWMLSRHTTPSDKATKPSIWQRLFMGESLTETGMRYRLFAFIAMMFSIINIIGTVVIYLASQAQG